MSDVLKHSKVFLMFFHPWLIEDAGHMFLGLLYIRRYCSTGSQSDRKIGNSAFHDSLEAVEPGDYGGYMGFD